MRHRAALLGLAMQQPAQFEFTVILTPPWLCHHSIDRTGPYLRGESLCLAFCIVGIFPVLLPKENELESSRERDRQPDLPDEPCYPIMWP